MAAWSGQLCERKRMKRSSNTRPSSREEIARLEDIPNVGPAIAADMRRLGITTPSELPGRDPYTMYFRIAKHRRKTRVFALSNKNPNCECALKPTN
jgi:hypothetical protein